MQKTTVPAGTMGYMAPEMHYTGRATTETDVYAFGVLVMEVVSGRRPFLNAEDGDEPGLLVERVWRAHEAGHITRMVDSRLAGHTSEMARFLQLGLLCCVPNPGERPSMRLVCHWLQSLEMGAVEFPRLPATQPAPPPRYVSPLPFSSQDSSHNSDKAPFDSL